ncbi:sensor histidine kinase [Micromonospora sp. NPDC005806]|uniref:sensor histidine kinase n=1 Tax=Micromonospora sp. NPDC005806 TaxID=3364234 RepID=UPI003682C256
MKTSPLRRWWFRLGRLAALAVLALLGLLDLRFGLLRGDRAVTLLAPVRVLPAVAVAVVWLRRHPSGSTRLSRWALVLAAASLAVTGLVRLVDESVAFETRAWGLAETTGLLGLLYVVARRAAARSAPWAVLALGAALILLPFRSGTDPAFVIFGLLLAMAGAGAVTAGTYLRMLDNDRRRALAEVRTEQRAEFARDLHDFIAHHVTGIIVRAQGARYVAEQDPGQATTALEQIERAAAETMASMRRMVRVLREPDAPLAPLAGATDLGPLLAGFNESGPPQARLHVDGELDGLPVEVSTSAYRVAMEALTNARRHAAGATAVEVSLRRTPEWLFVRVADDGAPPRHAGGWEHSGTGLLGLAERVGAVGGWITAGPGVDRGWLVDAALPLTERERP